MQNSHTLLQPYSLSAKLKLKNKIIMAPMTRNMANDDLSPIPAMVDYYARRADAGLIITEGTIIRPDARGYSNAPGIYTQAHIDAWKKVTDAVHKNGGVIFSQLWHVGRVSHPSLLDGQLPLSPSKTMMHGPVKRANNLNYGESRAVTDSEISALVVSFAEAAKNAMQAGFDGIELHGANGYLIDQFLHYSTNLRTDNYGGTPENMARFALEIINACGSAIGYDRIGIRLSPGAYLNEMVGDLRDAAVFQYLLQQLNKLNIAYVHTGNYDDETLFLELENKTMTEFMRQYYKGNIVACGGYDFASAEKALREEKFNLVAMGRSFIANPDLIERVTQKKKLRPYNALMLKELY